MNLNGKTDGTEMRGLLNYDSLAVKPFLSVGSGDDIAFILRFTVQKLLAALVLRKKVKKRKRFAVWEEQTMPVLRNVRPRPYNRPSEMDL